MSSNEPTPVKRSKRVTLSSLVLPSLLALVCFVFNHFHEEVVKSVEYERAAREKVEVRVFAIEAQANENKNRITTIEAQNGYIKQLLEEVRNDVKAIKDNMKKP